ncbi:MAG: MBL fold metallo-hydrolase [Planctomycetes bacterium]|nr:MBL fold metallo-hydrolase [Planctomycetota bacterium]
MSIAIGGWRIDAVETGKFWLDGGAMFGVVPKTMWAKLNPPDDRNRIEMGMRAMLLRGHGRTVLVDCGPGDKWTAKMADIYGIDTSQSSIDRGLAVLGVKPGDITDLVLTHLHFDHAGGLSKFDSNGRPALVFPGAFHWIQRSNLDWARKPHERERASYLEEHVGPLGDAPGLKILDGPEEIYPGLGFVKCDGHTFGQQLPLITGPEGKLFYCADLIPTFSHLPVTWVMGYDLNALLSMKEKKAVLERAAKENWILFSEHDARTAAARVSLDEKGKFVAGEPVKL